MTFTDSQLDVFSGLSFNYQAGKDIWYKIKKGDCEQMITATLKKEGFTAYPRWKYFWMIISGCQ